MLYSLDSAVEERAKWKLDEIKKAEADCIVVVCPACYDQLERAQYMLKRRKLTYDIPIIHLTELMSFSTGFSPKEIGLDPNYPLINTALTR